MQRHEAAKLDAEMTGGKVVSLMHKKPLLLVISGNGWAPNLDDVHVIS
jgi:hypothetical protein